MATQVQFRRGTTTQNNAFTGAAGEITYDTDIKTLRLHDGISQGGGAIVATTQATQTFLNKTHSTGSVWNGSVIGLQYGGTGGSITSAAGAVAYSTSQGLALSLPGTSGQVLISGGTSGPSWVSSTSLQAGNSVNATFATNVAGGSAGQLIIQQDNSLTTFITAGASGTFLKSNGAGYAPGWSNGEVTYGSTTVAFGQTSTSLDGLTSINSTSVATSFFASPAAPVLFAGATSVTVGNSATSVTIGNSAAATLTLRPGTVVGSNTTQNLYNTVSTTVNAFGAATTISLGAATGVLTINNAQTVFNSTNSIQLPVGTTAQRPASPAVGQVRYNSTISSYEGYASGAWSSLGGVKSVDGLTYIIAETSAGASNDELEFYTATDASNTAKRGGWNATRLLVSNTTASTSSTTGALQVSGGVGIAGAVYIGGTLNVAGNLSVSGTTTTTNSQSLTVTTPQLFLASDNAGNSTDVGLLGGYVSSGNKKMGLIKQASSGEWRLFSNGTGAPGTTYDFTGVTYDVIRLGGIINTGNMTVSGTYDRSPVVTLTGDATGSVTLTNLTSGSGALTLANSGVSAGSYGSASAIPTFTVDGKGRLTAAGTVSINFGAYAALTGATFTGTVYAPAFQISSDARLKDNVVDSKYGLSTVLQLRSVEYDRQGKHDVGLIAQDVETIIPEFVSEDADGMKTVNYPQMVSVLIKAVQELSAEVNALKAKLGE